MGSKRAISLAVWMVQLLLLGCTPELGPEPVLTRVDPAYASTARSTPVHIQGDHFSQRFDVDYSHPSHSGARGEFTLELLAQGTALPLEGTTFIDSTGLSATVAAGTPTASYALRLTDPWGRQTTLANALTLVTGCVSDLDCDDGVPCTRDLCQATQCQHLVSPDHCLINGACHPSSDPTCNND